MDSWGIVPTDQSTFATSFTVGILHAPKYLPDSSTAVLQSLRVNPVENHWYTVLFYTIKIEPIGD